MSPYFLPTGNMFITAKTCIPVDFFSTTKIPITRYLLSNVSTVKREQMKPLPVARVVQYVRKFRMMANGWHL